MRRVLSFFAAAFGFVLAASASYLVLVEGLGWEHGVIKLAAPVSICGALLGWEAVDWTARLLGGGKEQKTT